MKNLLLIAITIPTLALADPYKHMDLTQQAFVELTREQQCDHLGKVYSDIIDARFIDGIEHRDFKVAKIAALASHPEQVYVREWLFGNLDDITELIYETDHLNIVRAGEAIEDGVIESYIHHKTAATAKWVANCKIVDAFEDF